MKRLAIAALALAAGCDGAASSYSPPPVTPVLPDAATTGTIRGEVRYDAPLPEAKFEPMGGSPECTTLAGGKTPKQELLVKDGRLRNAFVHIKQGLDPKYKWAIPTEEHVVSNQKCLYNPRVSGARTWQKVKFLNQDATQHNFRSDPWSRTLSSQGQSVTIWYDKPQLAALRCDLHNWMLGHLWIMDHPYFGVTGEDGAFEIKDVPPGDYTLEAWHETLGTQSATVKLEPKGSATATLTFKK